MHLPASKYSARRFVTPLLRPKQIKFDLFDKHARLATLEHDKVIKGVLDSSYPVAIKLVPWSRSDLAWNEVEIFSALPKHPTLLEFFGISQTDDNFLIISELASHRTLRDILVDPESKGSINPKWLTTLASVMNHLHANDVIHRDLCPEHILLDQTESTIKLADLNHARILRGSQLMDEPLVLPKESLLYAAPELLGGKPYDRKVDVYSFGAIMYECIHNVSLKTLAARPAWTHPDQNLRRLCERCMSLAADERPEFEEISETLQRDFPIPIIAPQDKQYAEENLPRVGTCASIGHVRKSMEDALMVVSIPDSSTLICGVFDGLRDSRTAEFAAKKCALNAFVKTNEESSTDLKEIVESALRVTDDSLKTVVPPTRCGSTATMAAVDQLGISLGWLGDSSAYLFRKADADADQMKPNYQAVSLITKHAPNRPDELARIDANNGVVVRETMHLTNGERRPIGPWRAMAQPNSKDDTEKSRVGLAVSRALGLFDFRPIISGEPEFASLEKKPERDLFLILASDGL